MSESCRAEEMRALMAGFPTGVSIVTSMGADGQPKGMTCTSLTSVALDPPTLLVCLRRGSPTLDAVLHSGCFAVNLLHQQARDAAQLFASGDVSRFERIEWVRAPAGGPHLVQAVHAIADCTLSHHHLVGDHEVVLAEVVEVSCLQRPPLPLLFGMRRYGLWTDESAADGARWGGVRPEHMVPKLVRDLVASEALGPDVAAAAPTPSASGVPVPTT